MTHNLNSSKFNRQIVETEAKNNKLHHSFSGL